MMGQAVLSVFGVLGLLELFAGLLIDDKPLAREGVFLAAITVGFLYVGDVIKENRT
jgi:hypothetical protein